MNKMANMYSGSLFQPIDNSMMGWEDELKRREQLNSQIDFLNQLASSNPGNKMVNDLLLNQYMGLVFPQNDPSADAESAMSLISLGLDLGDEELKNAGMSMLKKNSIYKDYFNNDTLPTASDSSNALSDMYKSSDKATGSRIKDITSMADLGDRSKYFEDLINAEEDTTKQEALKGVKDYYTNTNEGNLFFQQPFFKDLEARLSGQDYNTYMGDANKRRQKELSGKYKPYLQAYGLL